MVNESKDCVPEHRLDHTVLSLPGWPDRQAESEQLCHRATQPLRLCQCFPARRWLTMARSNVVRCGRSSNDPGFIRKTKWMTLSSAGWPPGIRRNRCWKRTILLVGGRYVRQLDHIERPRGAHGDGWPLLGKYWAKKSRARMKDGSQASGVRGPDSGMWTPSAGSPCWKRPPAASIVAASCRTRLRLNCKSPKS